MHEAYCISPLLNLPVQIESIVAFDDNLIVGTRQGYLYVYRVNCSSDEKYEVELTCCLKMFSKKSIQQLEVIPEYNLLVSLTDNMIQVNDMKSNCLPIITQIAGTKGATIFTLDSQKVTSSTGEVSHVIRMCVAVKRKLQLYYWKKDNFMTLAEDILLTDVPKALVWCSETICVGFKGEYLLFYLNRTKKELFPTSSSKSNDPRIMKVSDTIFALGRDAQTVLMNVEGLPEKNKALRWSDIPIAMAWDKPYVVGVLPEGIEVQTIDPGGLVQKFNNLPKARLITFCKQGLLYVASVSHIWCLHAVEIGQQRQQLLKEKQFELALKLTEVSNELEEDKDKKKHQIQTLLAYDLFKNKAFHESMQQFSILGTDPYDVIRLFPELLPQQSGEVDKLENLGNLSDSELERGLLALIEYLTKIRYSLLVESEIGTKNATGKLNDAIITDKPVQQLLPIIDTTLLKCYLQTNDVLVAPLLRLNHCHLGEAEKTLKKYGKHNELIILYQTKGQHRKALELLQNSEGRIERTIAYLQQLGAEHMGLILEFSDWVLKEAAEDGLKIFMEDLVDVEALPRPRVLDYLLRSHPTLVIPYLEHIIHKWGDKNPLFHNALIHQYREQSLSDNPSVEDARKKLLNFLETSSNYAPDSVLMLFSNDRLLEERAIILGKLGRYEDALSIYVRALGDVQKAIRYCENVFNKNENAKKVYVCLIKLLLSPNNVSLDLPGLTLSPRTAQPDLEMALKLMEEYASKIDPLSALETIPDNVLATRIFQFLSAALHKTLHERRTVQLLKGLFYAQHLQGQEARLRLQSQCVVITDLNICPVCKKRFSHRSALVRYPNGNVVHYNCHDKKI